MRRGVIQKVVMDGQTKNKINREILKFFWKFCFAVKLPKNSTDKLFSYLFQIYFILI